LSTEAKIFAKKYITVTWTWTFETIAGVEASQTELVDIPIEVWHKGVVAIADWLTDYFASKWAVSRLAVSNKSLFDLSTDWYAKHRAGIEAILRKRLEEHYKRKSS
jgi:hypothetical protein